VDDQDIFREMPFFDTWTYTVAMLNLEVGRMRYRTLEAQHPYTLYGQQIDVEWEGDWIEIGECGLINPMILIECGHHPARASGLAMGLGLDRILMLRKGFPDIRLLRSREPGISEQMLDLSPYREPEEHHGRDWSPGMSDAHIMRALASTIRYKNPQNS
jgi:phenylalanyl-tRNA synthetase alpha chain